MTPHALEVVPFHPGLEGQVTDLILEIQQGEFGMAITAADQPDLTQIPGFYQVGDGNFWVALAGARVVGTTPHFVAAHRFYERNGFEEIAMAALPPGFPIMEVDTKFYRLRLAPPG